MCPGLSHLRSDADQSPLGFLRNQWRDRDILGQNLGDMFRQLRYCKSVADQET